MKSKLISVFIVTTLSTIGLCSTISHAADKSFIIQSANENTNTSALQVVEFIHKGSKQISLLNINTLDEITNKPFLNIYSSITAEYMSEQRFIKKNEMFELATIFNDKLQQILAKLSFDESPQNKNHFINSDKPRNNNSINCNTTKH